MKITDTHVYFYSGREIYSNFRRCKFTDFDYNFESSEQHFMFNKANFFYDGDSAHKLLNEVEPKKAKDLGRIVSNYDDKAWSCVRLGFMTYANYLKFDQNEDFKRQLLETEDKILVEAAPNDRIWGVGLAEDDARILDDQQWRGTNLLGIALMAVRDLLK